MTREDIIEGVVRMPFAGCEKCERDIREKGEHRRRGTSAVSKTLSFDRTFNFRMTIEGTKRLVIAAAYGDGR